MVDRRNKRTSGLVSRRRAQEDEILLEIAEAHKVLMHLEEARAEMQYWSDEWWALGTRSKYIRRFVADGGCTLVDLKEFSRSGKSRGCHVKRKHLRLVVKNKSRRVRLSGRGPSAA